jgi:hypothetical protein
MFDWYEPQPAIPCRRCGRPLEWQGKEGPNLLLRWRQGSRAPVGQDCDDQWAVQLELVEPLPTRFEIHAYCCGEGVEGVGHASEGTWSHTWTSRPEASHQGENGRWRCPCCDHFTLEFEPSGSHEICAVCGWEDDRMQTEDIGLAGRSNELSLRDARVRAFGAPSPARAPHRDQPDDPTSE